MRYKRVHRKMVNKMFLIKGVVINFDEVMRCWGAIVLVCGVVHFTFNVVLVL